MGAYHGPWVKAPVCGDPGAAGSTPLPHPTAKLSPGVEGSLRRNWRTSQPRPSQGPSGIEPRPSQEARLSLYQLGLVNEQLAIEISLQMKQSIIPLK